ncbi:MAG: Na+/H+ antiporter [Cyclobacteriaceae bacterium]|jgi:CPA1 family monovalent cation:H+ antiporter|nr:Na+/H+ antiporter [Cyclobacteriaceae bacterium]
MSNIAIVIILLAIVTALAQITDKVRIPYPILLVLAGIAIGLVPGLPVIKLDPDIVFLVFLPPVLYAAAWTTSWPDFKESIRPISLLAIGCVLFTTLIVAFAAHYFIPGFGWVESFVLGAIVSPPDAVAATAATKGLKVPKRIITILEGESLVNDATGLIAYRYAVAAAASGTFIFWLAGLNFFYVAGLGIILGILVGYVFYWIHKITPNNATTDSTFTLLAPYSAYLLAEEVHASGVLAVVAAGLFLSPRSSEVFSNRTRIQASAVWDTLIFVLNGIIFILIGLQLPAILENIKTNSITTLIWYGVVVSVATVVARIIWVFPGAFLPRWLSKSIREKEKDTNVKSVGIVAWSGMRGIVSLAAALAIPIMVTDTKPFPNRDLIIFLTFCVIFVTLVLQGMTIRKLIQFLGIKTDDQHTKEEERVRVELASSLIEHIEENFSLDLSEVVLSQIKSKYENRIQRIRKEESTHRLAPEQIEQLQRIQQQLINQEREYILRLRREGKATDELVRKIEYELDLEEARLELEQGA